ncbi:MAG: translation initiation factor IF-2 [Opitutales bacterium]
MSVRIYQLARQLNMENKKVLELLQKRGMDVKSPSSTIPNLYAEEFLKEFQNQGQKASEAPITEKKSAEKVSVTKPVSTTVKAAPALPKKPNTLIVANASSVAPREPVSPKTEKKLDLATKLEMPKLPPKNSVVLPKVNLLMPKPPIMRAPQIQPRANLQAKTEVKTDEPQEVRQITLKPPIVVRDFANLLNIKPFRLISELMEQGIFASMNQTIDETIAQKIANKYKVELILKHRTPTVDNPQQKKVDEEKKRQEDELKYLEPRPPIVCILGHVDHGKTTLLDYIRKAHVAAKEAGGITQHVGAYQVEHEGKKITFLDTPGHAAFSKIRQRGATVTDIAILVVAADDGFMPQTEEALQFAQKENVPVIVAINKMDAKGANEDKIKQQMQKHGITSEDWGGETLCTGISALKGTNISKLLELVLLQAEMMELKANPKGSAEGVIIESRIEVGRGATATVIVNKGTLKPGDVLVCGPHFCKVRALLNENGEKMKEATPATPVQILGWSGAPDAGANFRVVKNEKEARREAEEVARQLKQEEANNTHKVKNVEELMAAIQSTEKKVLKVILRADVHGSVEALSDCLMAIQSQKVSLEIVDAQVGQINLNDVNLAHAAQAIVVGFNTRLENGVQAAAKHHQIRILQHNIIYELIDQVKDAMRELLDPEWSENKLGSAEVRKVFALSKNQIAGCMVVAGRMIRDGAARLIRSGKVLADTHIQMLKRFKDDVTEVKSGYECGIELSNLAETFQEGDVIECYEMVSRQPDL